MKINSFAIVVLCVVCMTFNSEKIEDKTNLRTFSVGFSLSDIIKIGKAVWDFIKDNRAVVDMKTDWAGAMPKGIPTPIDMSGWQTVT